MARALFVCLHNAGRSQMSEALFTRAAEGRHQARSAGTTPGDRVHPEVVEVMAELGIDLADRKPHKLSRKDAEWADVVVTMGCGDKCPYIPGKRYIDWDLPDPKGQPVEAVRATREEIERRVQALVEELDESGREDLTSEDQRRVEEEVRRMVAELRARPTQEKEDALGLTIANMPEAEQQYVTTLLLRMLAEDTS